MEFTTFTKSIKMTRTNTPNNSSSKYKELADGVFKLATTKTGKIILVIVGTYSVIYISKYVLNTTAGSIRAVKNLISAIKE